MNANPEITPADAATRPAGVMLLDVREHDEWNAGHAPGAHHIPLGELHPKAIPTGTSVMCACRAGGRSSSATSMLRSAGIDAKNITGGMNAWSAAGLPVVRDDGQPGTVI